MRFETLCKDVAQAFLFGSLLSMHHVRYLPRGDASAGVNASVAVGCAQPRCGDADGVGTPFACGTGAVVKSRTRALQI